MFCMCVFFFFVCVFFFDVFFFQAEDGIRDLVRSRGLGDVYKRQDDDRGAGIGDLHPAADPLVPVGRGAIRSLTRRLSNGRALRPVSYTHLTLPTSDLV